MIEFKTLGGLDLHGGPDERRLRSVLSQVKRVGLLAYLLLARPRGFHRRDTLLAIFWPESSDSRARHALNQATYVLRRALGPDVIEGRGREEIGVRPGAIDCDAVRFDAALDAGDATGALELYAGELLPGFHLAAGGAFERWLEGERARLRDRARAAALALADEAETAGNVAAMLRFTRRARTIAPDDERTARRLIARLDRAGDRAGALREYERLAARLAREYDAEPARETAELVERIRADSPSRHGLDDSSTGPASSRASAGDDAPDPASPPRGAPCTPARGRSASRTAEPDRKRWRRVAALAGLAAVLTAGAWLALDAVGERTTASDASAPETVVAPHVAVLPFAVHGSAGSDHLREGLAGLIATGLNGIGEIRSIESRALVRAVGPETPPPPEAAGIAQRFDAELFVLGDVVANDRRLRVTASLYERSTLSRPIAEVTVEGGRDEIFRLVDELTLGLVRGLGGERSSRPVGVAALTTSSLPALRAYLEGHSAARAGRYADAVEAFGRAVQADSTFALAHFGLSEAANWEGEYGVAKSAAAAAVRHGDRLSRLDRLHAQAWHAYQRGAGDLADRLYRTILAEDPADPHAWFQLGEVTFHWGPLLGRPPAASRTAWERVLAQEPDHAGALIHLIRIAALERRLEELDTLTTRLLSLAPGAVPALEARALRAFIEGGPDDQARLLAQAEYAQTSVLYGVALAIAAFGGVPTGAAALLDRTAARAEDAERRRTSRLMLVLLEAARGRRAAAADRTDDLRAIAPGWALEYRAMLATLPFGDSPEVEMERLRTRLIAATGVVDGPSAGRVRLSRPPATARTAGSAPRGAAVDPARRLYLLGLLSHRLGDDAATADYIARLDRFRGDEPERGEFAADFARTLRAERAESPDEALAILGPPALEPDSMFSGPMSYPKAYERWLRAESLRELGRTADALDWYGTFPAPTAYDLVYVAPSYQRRAELYRTLGDRDAAAWNAQRARAWWREP
ncbi:MAG: BTAD domain-containing putative transcriptional regulator [Gemmatimonadota bacterium]